MIIGSADINFDKNALSASEAQETADDALEKAKEALKLNNTAWYLQSVALTSANGQNTNFYGAKTPEDPKENDLWFVYNEDGNVTNMLRYKNGEWVAEVDLSKAQEMLKQAEEIAKRMDNNTTKFNSLFSNVTDLWKDSNEQNGKITSVKASVDGLQTTVNNLSNSTSSQITQLSDQVNLKVSKGDVISQINLEADSAYISSKAIVLDADTRVLGSFTVDTANITGKLSANQIAVSQLSALTADLGNVTAGRISGVEINVSTDVTVGNNLYLGTYLDKRTEKRLYFNDKVYFGSYYDGYGSSVDIKGGNRFNISLSDENSNIGSFNLRPTMFSVNAEEFYFSASRYRITGGNVILSKDLTVNGNMYCGTDRVVVENNFRGYLSGSVYIGDASIGVGGTFIGDSSTSNVSIGSSNIYVPGKVYAGGSALTSDRDKKKNINPYKKEALPEILSTQIYTYNLKTELDGEFPHLGIILQEAPVDIVDPSGGIELYAMTSFAWKAIQELSAQNNSLKQRIEALENR